jgi:hypothetical protein
VSPTTSSRGYANPSPNHLTLVATPTPEHQNAFDTTGEESGDTGPLDAPRLDGDPAGLNGLRKPSGARREGTFSAGITGWQG